MKNDAGKPAYEVGYSKPPAETRFKKGQSGNPGGALAIHAANVAMTKNDLTMLKAMGAFDEPTAAPQPALEDVPWRCTLVFDNEPQLTAVMYFT